jgi:Zn-dependent protease with chaperone function
MVVSRWAVDNLTEDELTGVLAHELSHHLGMHTVALTVNQWLTIPVVLFARVGYFLQNVAQAAGDTRAVEMGFGRQLLRSLRRVIDAGGGERPAHWRDRLVTAHPPARTRVARIEAQLRRQARGTQR